MGIESDINSFHELALEEQLKIPYYIDKYGNHSLVYDNLNPLLYEITEGNPVTITGEAYLPVLNEHGQYIGTSTLAKGELLVGECSGVEVSSREDIGVSEDSKYIISYLVGVYAIKRSTALEKTTSHFYGFAPIEGSSLMIPEKIVEKQNILPDTDDPLASHIDESLFNHPIRLTDLNKIFLGIYEEMSDMHMDFYLNYTNQNLPLDKYISSVQSNRLIKHVQNSQYRYSHEDVIDRGSSFIAEIRLKRFEFYWPVGLSVIFFAKETKSNAVIKYLIPINSLISLNMTNY